MVHLMTTPYDGHGPEDTCPACPHACDVHGVENDFFHAPYEGYQKEPGCKCRVLPPLPMDEPTELESKVRDADGKVWMRYFTVESGRHWWSNSGGGWRAWEELEHPEPYTEPEEPQIDAQTPVGTMQRRIYARDLLDALTAFIECEPRLHKEEHAALDLLAKTTLPEYIESGF